MNKIALALIWAAAIIGISVASIFDIVPTGFAEAMVFTLPALAWLSISGGKSCLPCPLTGRKGNA